MEITQMKTIASMAMFIEQAEGILKDLGYQEWTIKVIHSGGGLCNHKSKEIWLDHRNLNIPFLLHEIAHIKHRGHDALWADHFTELLVKYDWDVNLNILER